MGLRNSAKYFKNGKIEETRSEDLMSTAKPYFIYPGFAFVAYANRDSTVYKERYQIPEAQTIIRGTLRYQGYPEFARTLIDIGFISEDKLEYLEKPIAWNEATQRILGASSNQES